MPSREERERPKAVAVISGIWLALAAVSLFKTAANFILWRALQPAIPSLVDLAARQDPRTRFLDRLFEHYGAVLVFQAILTIAVGFSAYQLLRLRPWARLAVQAICWLALVYVASFAVFWLSIWTRASAAHERGPILIVAGLSVCVALATGLAVMIGMLRGRRLRAVFTPPPASAPIPR
jgi:hypothetical protein